MKSLSKPFYLAGVQFQDLTGFFAEPHGGRAELSHNPNNRFDPFAVEVRFAGYLVGHIPRQELAMLFHVARQPNVTIECWITAYDKSKPPYQQFLTELRVSDNASLVVPKVHF